jgi:hypothetical protein
LWPEFEGECEVLNAEAQQGFVPGTLIHARPLNAQTTADRYLMVQNASLDLDQFRVVHGTPGGMRAGFKQWSIWAVLPFCPDYPTKIFDFGKEKRD